MANKTIGYYQQQNTSTTSPSGKLVVEISPRHIACLVKNTETATVEAFELFDLELEMNDWSDVFYEVRQSSQLLNSTYAETHIFYNFNEAVLIPAAELKAAAAEDYLSLLFGESTKHEVKYDRIVSDHELINAYRIRRSLHELAGRYFVLYQIHHTYSRMLEDVLQNRKAAAFIKVQFYSEHFIVIVLKDKKLQLIQSYGYKGSADILYHLLHIADQYGFDLTTIPLELSGMLDPQSTTFEQLQQVFGCIVFDEVTDQGIFKEMEGTYPDHYFTPFYKLSL